MSTRFFTPVLGLGQICSWGTLYYSFPLIALQMQIELGWSRSDLYMGATLGLLSSAILSYPVGLGIDRGYGRSIMAGASVSALIMFGWWSATESLLAFYIICCASGAIQAALLYEPAFAVLARRVGSLNARAGITHITLWGGFASTVFIPITEWLILGSGWRNTLLCLGCVNVVFGVVYWRIILPSLDVNHAHDPLERQSNVARDRQVVRDSLHQGLFWLILLTLAIYAAMFSAFTFHMYPLLQEDGLDASEVITAIAIIGPAQVLGRYLVTLFASELPMRRLGSIVVAVFPIAFICLTVMTPSFGLVLVMFAAYGMANGIFTIVRSFVVPEMLSPHAYGALNGLLTIAATLARAIAPLAAAWLWSINQSYMLVMWAIVGSSVLLALGFWWAALRTRTNAILARQASPTSK
jgi:predicted MFS family arabinose efflux permease